MRLESPDSLASSNAASLPFEEALTSLQDVVARLEGGNLTLDETIASFKQGSELAARCQKLISEAELRVTEVALVSDQTTAPAIGMPDSFQ